MNWVKWLVETYASEFIFECFIYQRIFSLNLKWFNDIVESTKGATLHRLHHMQYVARENNNFFDNQSRRCCPLNIRQIFRPKFIMQNSFPPIHYDYQLERMLFWDLRSTYCITKTFIDCFDQVRLREKLQAIEQFSVICMIV